MTTKHTPGPWTVERKVHICKDSEIVASLIGTYNSEGNASLIAAAPRMYEFLQMFFGDGECEQWPGEYPEKGEAGKAPCKTCQAKEILDSIAKAEGKA